VVSETRARPPQRYKSSPSLRERSYMERTAHCWGRRSGRRDRTLSDALSGDEGPRQRSEANPHGRPRAVTVGELGTPEAEECPPERAVNVDDPDMREIFPVPEGEVVLAGDVLLLSLPRDACVDLVDSPRFAQLLHGSGGTSGQVGAGAAPRQVGLRMCDLDLLEVPGRQGEFVELVVSHSNPFVGADFSGEGRHAFEEYYQVAVLAVRQSTWAAVGEAASRRDLLLSYANKDSTALANPEESADEDDHDVKHINTEGSEVTASRAGAECTDDGMLQEMGEREVQRLRPGDAVLVLARATGAGGGERFPVRDFLAKTTVAQEPEFAPPVTDYAPLGLFIIGIVLVASQQVSMVQVSMGLAAIYLLCGWVTTKELRECVDWNMLVLIGSALGLARAVQNSGLSGAVASCVKGAKMGPRGTVFVLYLFTMAITELVTNNAAAALAFPLAADITSEMGLTSVKPLAMTVMIATSTCYVNPIGTAPNLMVMGPGGYTFMDFVKVGFLMDIICWVNAGIFIPIVWPMEVGAGAA